MNKGQRLYKFILGLLMPFLFLACSSKERIKIDGGTFNVDGKDVQLICGEMHYARIPHEYWRDRLKRARAMGLNSGTFTNDSPVSLISAGRRMLPNLYVWHRRKACM